MNYPKILVLTVTSAMALMAFVSVSVASATTLEVGGTTKNEAVSIAISLTSETSGYMRYTSGAIFDTCTVSTGEGSTTSPYTGELIAGEESSSSLSSCSRPVTIHEIGEVSVTWRSGSTDGTVFSKGDEFTVRSPLLEYLICTTGEEGTHVGTVTGISEGYALMDINAVVTCTGGTTTVLEATYTVTSPEGLGISS
ncbi:MAG TPA: hypothetical protein VFM51_04980 [Solirubrobacterales bacterium]|nr:hypothetical protein [Solirubrobacterales bacterium]